MARHCSLYSVIELKIRQTKNEYSIIQSVIMSFTHLHVHSMHSHNQSIVRVKEVVNEAIRLGMNALAITDYDSVSAAHEFVQHTRIVAPDFKPIIGCEMHVNPVNEATCMRFYSKAPHLTVLCKNETGYNNSHFRILAVAKRLADHEIHLIFAGRMGNVKRLQENQYITLLHCFKFLTSKPQIIEDTSQNESSRM